MWRYADGMPDDVYAWELVGGHLVLDWLNTRSWRRDPTRDHERLPDVEAFDRWRAEVSRLHAVDVPASEQDELVAIREVRDDVLALLDARAERPKALRFRDALAGAIGRSDLASGPPAAWHAPSDSRRPALDTLVLAADVLLRSDAAARIRQCGLHECGWYFLDTTRNRSRRWCTPDECGNLARVRRYSARRSGRSVELGGEAPSAR